MSIIPRVASVQKLIKLNNGLMMPSVGLGTWQSPPEQVIQAVKSGIQSGYKHFDCASIYRNEKDVGKALNDSFNKKVVNREDLFITSKLWNTHHKHVRAACEKTLKDLNLKYLDLYLIHWPISMAFNGLDLYDEQQFKLKRSDPNDKNSPVLLERAPIHETWYQMEKLVQDGLVRSIGVSNFNVQSLINLTSCATIQPVVNQVEVHPYLPQNDLITQAKSLADIHTVAYSPLGSNRQDGPINDPTVTNIASRLNKTSAQILLRWALQRGVMVIPKSVTPERIASNIQVFDFELSSEDMNSVDQLSATKQERYVFPAPRWGYNVFA